MEAGLKERRQAKGARGEGGGKEIIVKKTYILLLVEMLLKYFLCRN